MNLSIYILWNTKETTVRTTLITEEDETESTYQLGKIYSRKRCRKQISKPFCFNLLLSPWKANVKGQTKKFPTLEAKLENKEWQKII